MGKQIWNFVKLLLALMEQFKQQYFIESYYKFYVRYLLLSKFNFFEYKQLPKNISCNITSQIALNSNQVFLSWAALSILSSSSGLPSSKISNKKSLEFKHKKESNAALCFIMKLVYILLILKEIIDIFGIKKTRKDLTRKFSVILNDFPITQEFEKFAISAEKKPLGNLCIKLDLSISDDRSYVLECFWRMWSFPLECV